MKSIHKNTPLTTVWTSKTLSAILLVWLLSVAIQVFVNVRILERISLQVGLSSLISSSIFVGIGWGLAKMGRPKLGVLIVVLVAAVLSAVTIVLQGGLTVPVSQGYMTSVLLVGFIIGKRPGFITAICTVILYTVIFQAEQRGLIVSDTTLPLEQTYLFLLTRLFITTTFTYFAAQAIEDAFVDLSKSNNDLQQSEAINAQIRRELEESNAALATLNREMQVSENRYRTIVTSLGDAYFIARPPDLRLIDVNESACNLLGYTRHEFLTLTCLELNVGWVQSSLEPFYEEVYNDKNNTLRTENYIHKDGHIIPVEVRSSLIELEGEPAILAIVRDMSEQEAARTKIEASLHEKEILLREIHHRVKNNLQVVSSLMRTSSRKFPDDPLLRSEFKDLSSRVMSMAAIHQQLYQSGDFTQIEFAAYVRKLVKEIGRTHIPQSKEIALEFNLQSINLSLETAIPAGLIINELVINAIKHGYPPERKRGVIRCELVTDRYKDTVYLTVENDGLPFDAKDVENGYTMGMQLVDLLVRQIDGELMATNENGNSRFTFSFQLRQGRVPK